MDEGKVVPLDKGKKPPAPPTDKRPEIRLEPGDNPRITDQIAEAIAARGDVMTYGDRLAVVYRTTNDEKGAVFRPAGSVRVHYVDKVLLTEHADRAVRCMKYDGRIRDWRLVNVPKRYAETLMSRGHWPEFRYLAGFSEVPVIYRDEVIDRPGYHHNSGLYIAALPKGYRPLRDTPTPKEAEHAVDRLKESTSTFPYKTSADYAAGVALDMSAVLRRTLPSCPAFAINASTAGTGKSLRARVSAMLATGRNPVTISLSGKDEEDEKRLVSVLLASDPVVCADNIEGTIGCPLLNSMITEPEVAVRVLGISHMPRVRTNLTLILNGNNLNITRDMRRRVCLVNLDAGVEKPEERKFSRDAVDYVAERRAQLVRDVLTVSMAYLAAGEPHVGTSSYGSFEEWDRLVRRPLVWLGVGDPLEPAQGLREIDLDHQTTRALLHQWFTLFGGRGATSAEAITAARRSRQRFDGGIDWEHPELREVLQQIAGDRLETRTLSAWLRRHKERIVDGLALRQGEDHHGHVARWTVIECEVRRG